MAELSSIGGPVTKLQRPVSTVGELHSLPWLERLMLRKSFRGEQVHLAQPEHWLDRSWSVRLASVEGTVYKVGLEAEATDRADTIEVTTQIYSVLQAALGAPRQQGDGVFLWDAEDGNAILQFANVGGDRRIMLFFTSRIVCTFAPK
jgi:hypothetical protein